MSINKIKGFVDLFAPESETFTFIENTAREVFGRYGCAELRTPILEFTELFKRSIGEETDVVQKEMFTFPDRKDRSLTMRPEATAGVLRAFIESKRAGTESVTKLLTMGPMFRYERPQKGRQRQFNQVNVEVLGPSAPAADAEVLLMLWAFLKAIGLDELKIELNSLGCRACRPVYKKALEDFFAGLDQSGLCEDCRRRVGTNPLRVLDCKVPSCKALVADAPEIRDHTCPECKTHFADVLAIIDAAGLNYVLNPRLVRGLDYYQRTTFEVQSLNIGAQTAVAGGGRYDGLVRDLGGPDIPGVGFACGMERLAMLLDRKTERAADFHIAPMAAECVGPALLLAERLRQAGLRGETGLEAKSLKSQMRQADKSGAGVCLILGTDELAAGKVMFKDMRAGVQEAITPDEAVARLTDRR